MVDWFAKDLKLPNGDMHFNPPEWFKCSAWENNQTIYGTGIGGFSNEPIKILSFLEANGGKLRERSFSVDKSDTVSLYIFNHTLVNIGISKSVSVTLYSTNQHEVTRLAKGIAELLTNETPKGQIGMLVSQHGGLSIEPIGQVGRPLTRINYTDEVLTGYDKIVSELKKDVPFGRLHLLEGPAGTGKSFMISALIEEVNSQFVFIPGGMVAELAKPSLIPVLMQRETRENDEDKMPPLILVVEDADAIITKSNRGSNDILSTLLNLGDGILGNLANVRMVMSTNSKIEDVDDAIKRPGRMGTHLVLEELPAEKVAEIYKELSGEELDNPKPMTLANIYAMVKDREGNNFGNKRASASSGQYL